LGQKVNPIGIRLAVNKNWRSRWFSGKKMFGQLLIEDNKIRTFLKKELKDGSISDIIIERAANRLRVTIHTARPAVVIGPKGAKIDELKGKVAKMTQGKDVYIDIREVKDPDVNAQLVAEGIALQIERRVAIKRCIKRAIKLAMELGAKGMKIKCSGRLGGAEISRYEWSKEGKVPLHTLKEEIDYGFSEAHTTAGLIGVKVWVCKKPETKEVGKGVKSNASYA